MEGEKEKLYFIVKGSSTASKGTKTVFSFRHPKPPLELYFWLGYPENVSRAQYIYNEKGDDEGLCGWRKGIPFGSTYAAMHEAA